MNVRRLAVLQWVGLLLGAVVWAAQHALGWGFTEATCSSGHLTSNNDLWQAVFMSVAGALVLGAGAAAIGVLLETRELSYEDEPPLSRIRFFAIAAVAANVLFLMIILLDGFASIFNIACRQA
jgi:ABC-type nickel/cobalt efflux system permease component RcnA